MMNDSKEEDSAGRVWPHPKLDFFPFSDNSPTIMGSAIEYRQKMVDMAFVLENGGGGNLGGMNGDERGNF
jgi:hypothetical protein